MLPFLNYYMSVAGLGNFQDEEVEFIFNRDMIINESEILSTLNNLGVRISQETLLSQVPWIDDVKKEMDNIKKEGEEAIDLYGNSFRELRQDEGIEEKDHVE